LLTRTQWKMQGRRVVVSECDAKKIVTYKALMVLAEPEKGTKKVQETTERPN